MDDNVSPWQTYSPYCDRQSSIFNLHIFVFISPVLFYVHKYHDSWLLMLEGVESPHSTACLLNNNYRLHFTCYHFTYENFLKILRFESHCFQLYRAQLYVIGSRNKWVYCLSVLNGWKCCRYLGISNKVVILQFCFYKGPARCGYMP